MEEIKRLEDGRYIKDGGWNIYEGWRMEDI